MWDEQCLGVCPHATYLREAHDAYDIRVGEHTYRMMLPEGSTGYCALPDWATRFIDYVIEHGRRSAAPAARVSRPARGGRVHRERIDLVGLARRR